MYQLFCNTSIHVYIVVGYDYKCVKERFHEVIIKFLLQKLDPQNHIYDLSCFLYKKTNMNKR